jgi:diguanylate cyclase (GGDEF)-like protein
LRLPGRHGTTAQRWEELLRSFDGAGYHAQDRIQQHRRQIEPLAFRSPVVRDLAQNLEKRHLHPRRARCTIAWSDPPSTCWRCNASLTIWRTRLGVTRSSPRDVSISPARAQPRENARPPHRLAMGMSTEMQASYVRIDSSRARNGEQRWIRRLPSLIIGLIVLVVIGSIFDTIFDGIMVPGENKYRSDLENLHHVRMMLASTEEGLLGYAINGRLERLEQFLSGRKVVPGEIAPFLPQLDRSVSTRSGSNGESGPFSHDFEELQADWEKIVRPVSGNLPTQADIAPLLAIATLELSDRLKSDINGYIDQLAAVAAQADAFSDREQRILATFNVGGGVLAIIAMVYAFRSILRALDSGLVAKQQVDQLFLMTDMLQSAAGQDDTNEVLRNTSATLMPGFGGALYVFNNSRDRLDLSTNWGDFAGGTADHISPTSCWALKRGKSHLNQPEEWALRCKHVAPGQTTLEIPMAARGQLYGLLVIAAAGGDAAARLDQIRPVATAMGDAMSLALASIDLRERLRNLALRDGLTNLYNRRFLEEMLERLCADAERRKTSVSAIMLDLDHFKLVNDQQGHAAGDAVLREVAAAVLSCLRSVDVACRYGGEEFAIILPDCSVANAAAKAEQIRSRINERTTASGLAVTVSLGVASIPETCGGQLELIPAADAALYAARQQGRDRVVVAPLRTLARSLSLVETTSAVQTDRS